MGRSIKPKEALNYNVIQHIYKDDSELKNLIENFSNEFASKAKKRDVLGEIKRKIHYKSITEIDRICYGPY